MQKHISQDELRHSVDGGRLETPVRVTILTLDGHMASAVERAQSELRREIPGLELSLHAVSEWGDDPEAAERCRKDIETADIVVAKMIFMEDHARLIRPWLEARRDHCDCLVGCLSAADIVGQTRLGRFDLKNPTGGLIGLLKRLRGRQRGASSAGHGQMKMLRSVPRLLKYIPGKAQDLRAYFLTMQYLLASSDDNIINLVRFLLARYGTGPRAAFSETITANDPIEYSDIGLYHPSAKRPVLDDRGSLPGFKSKSDPSGTVGLIVMRSYVLAGNTQHYDGVIAALEARGLRVVPVFSSGLDACPAIERYFFDDGKPIVDAVVSLTGFSLVGGPAYNDAAKAEAMLASLDVPYLSAFAIEFQSLEGWRSSDRGLTPIETTMMVALPELDGATGPLLYGGRGEGATGSGRDMSAETDRSNVLAARVENLIRLRKKPKAERRLATVIYNFPPNGGAVGTAAYLSVFQSLFNLLHALKKDGYSVEIPENVDQLRDAILSGNAGTYGTPANVAARIRADDHVAGETWLDEIEAQWGPAPGKQLSDGSSIFVLGAHFGNVFVGVQPPFGYEGDPMRLLFEKGFAPTHAFSAFYRYLKTDLDADAVLHFGTHGALEFMPGKQVGLSDACWPERLIGTLPNFYLYAANNPSEGTIAKRRSAATLVSHLTPPLQHAGLYKGLLELKSSIDRWRSLPPEHGDRVQLAETIHSQAAAVELIEETASWSEGGEAEIPNLAAEVHEFEMTLIPHGLHVLGSQMGVEQRRDILNAVSTAMGEDGLDAQTIESIVSDTIQPDTDDEKTVETAERLAAVDADLRTNHELGSLLRALDARYVRPVAGGDVIRNPEIVPTGRNMHGFDPFRLPSRFALEDGASQAQRLIERHKKDHGTYPTSIAVVLWGSDNLKSEGSAIGQALALIGAKPRFDSYGRLCGADLVPLNELGRPRIDVVMTLSGIFRDLLPLQTKLLAEASLLAAQADEPEDRNFVRRNALAYAKAHDCPLETAALRVFSNAAGTYGSNVNLLIDSGMWNDEDEIADTYTRRKCFAYGVDGQPARQSELLASILNRVDAAYQNLESVELGVTSIDHYFDTLGGISKAIRTAGGGTVPVYIGDQTVGSGKVRTLEEQVALEARTRMLNPKWYEGLLEHGYEGVRQIESHVTNTLGWSATTGQVAPWVYQNLAETFVLDAEMRKRLGELNPKASMKLADRLMEAQERQYWQPDEATMEALRSAGEALEDQLEGVKAAAA
ncbi:MAG: magnesium chelatase subunit H [Pseudomonadota bacterium]